jgi:hypothetical protein
VSQPFEVFGSQDLKDDDGPVIDSFLIETDAPPNPADAPEPITIPALPAVRPMTRLITGYQVMSSSTQQPIMIAPADANRKQITIKVTSTAASPTQEDYLLLSDEVAKVTYGTGQSGIAARFRQNTEPYNPRLPHGSDLAHA